jgi:hypothetical protein
MAGRVVVSTLNNDTGVLATQNGMTGIAKAWVNFNGTGTVAIRGSMNVSSITDNGTGNYTINFTTAMPNANYAISTGYVSDALNFSTNPRVCYISSQSTTTIVLLTGGAPSGAFLDFPTICASVFSS